MLCFVLVTLGIRFTDYFYFKDSITIQGNEKIAINKHKQYVKNVFPSNIC